jgi:hypothetical protein
MSTSCRIEFDIVFSPSQPAGSKLTVCAAARPVNGAATNEMINIIFSGDDHNM